MSEEVTFSVQAYCLPTLFAMMGDTFSSHLLFFCFSTDYTILSSHFFSLNFFAPLWRGGALLKHTGPLTWVVGVMKQSCICTEVVYEANAFGNQVKTFAGVMLLIRSALYPHLRCAKRLYKLISQRQLQALYDQTKSHISSFCSWRTRHKWNIYLHAQHFVFVCVWHRETYRQMATETYCVFSYFKKPWNVIK